MTQDGLHATLPAWLADADERPLPREGEPGPGLDAPDPAMYRVMVENAVDMIIRYDAASRRVYASPASREILGYEPWEMLGNQAQNLIHPADLPAAEASFRRIGPLNPSLKLVYRARRKDGEYIWVEGHYRYLPDDNGVIAVIRDITARKQAEELLAESNAKLAAANHVLRALARQDALTGLSNRRHFDELIDEEHRRARRMSPPLGVVMLDVDSFKSYNDTYGHLAGDDCLRRIGAAVMSVMRRPGDHAARYGGEEIAVLLPATDLAGTTAVAERIRAVVAALAIEHAASPCGHVTISAGTSALMPPDDLAPTELLDAADQALYRAKSDGRNRVRQSRQVAMALSEA